MGCINVEILTNGKKLSFETESNGLYRLNCLSNIIETQDNISEILVTEDLVILRTEDRDFRNGALQAPWIKDDRRINNINAYDWNGRHLWNIGDIVGDIKMAFNGCTVTSNANLVDTGELVAENSHSKNLLICVAGGYRFIIDPVKKTILSKTNGKW
ncbi:MAG: hypothetical protein E7603_01215 [Ruminococcaceae bacterium]|nr:hypothetical protein [Oscillospiraceae bacterium]